MSMRGAKKTEVVVITGASSGLGRATARLFAAAGAHVGLIARGRDGLAAAQREVEARGGKALAVPADVASAVQLKNAAAAIEECLGAIDIWVNNAAVSVFSPLEDLSPAEFKRVTEITYLGSVYGTLVALKYMRPRDRGVIIQVGAPIGRGGLPLQAAYCGAKQALNGFIDSLRSELRHSRSRVRVAMVQPPLLNTPLHARAKNHLVGRRLHPAGRIFQPEVAAEAIYWAAHHRRSAIRFGPPVRHDVAANGVPTPPQPSGETALSIHRADNLWEAVPGDLGTRGAFTSSARESSLRLWLVKNRPAIALAGMAAALALACVIKQSRHPS